MLFWLVNSNMDEENDLQCELMVSAYLWIVFTNNKGFTTIVSPSYYTASRILYL